MDKRRLEDTLLKLRVTFYSIVALSVITLIWDYQTREVLVTSLVVRNNTNKTYSGQRMVDSLPKMDLDEMAKMNLSPTQYQTWHYELDILTESEDEFFEIERLGDDYYRVMREDAEEPLDGHYAFDLLEEVEEVELLYKYAKQHPEFRTERYYIKPKAYQIRFQ